MMGGQSTKPTRGAETEDTNDINMSAMDCSQDNEATFKTKKLLKKRTYRLVMCYAEFPDKHSKIRRNSNRLLKTCAFITSLVFMASISSNIGNAGGYK
jgi:hypothetical protein